MFIEARPHGAPRWEKEPFASRHFKDVILRTFMNFVLVTRHNSNINYDD